MRKWTGCSVLIVEDSDDYQQILVKMLTDLGFTASVCNGGHQALERLATHPVDLIISDIQMPYGDGFYLLKQLRDAGDQTPLLLISAGADLSHAKLLLIRANGFIKKPFDCKRLAKVIEVFFKPDPQ